MKYTMFIDQIHSIEWGLNLQEAAIFNFLYSVPTWAEAKLIDGKLFYHASRNKAIQDYPIVSEKPDTVYRIYRRLQSAGVIEWMKDGLKDMILITDKGKQWNSSEKNPTLTQELGKKSDRTRKKIRNSSENFPTYTSTINTVTNNTIEEPQNENDLLVETNEEFEGMAVTTIEILPIIPSAPKHFKDKYDEEMEQLQKEYDQLPKVDPETAMKELKKIDAEIKASKRKKYIYPPTIEELIQPIYEKLIEKKRIHTNIVDCWNNANMQAEKFHIHWEEKGWKIEKLNLAIAKWINNSISYGQVTKPCPIQYKGNPANAQPAPTKVHVEETKSPEQSKEARKAMFAAAKAELNQIGA